MKTIKLQPVKLPQILPHGWKKEVAIILGIHQNSMSRALRRGSGLTYNKIVKIAAEKYGEKVIND